MKQLNLPLIGYIFGLLLLMESAFMLLATGVAGYYSWKVGDGDLWALAVPTLLAAATGGTLMRVNHKHSEKITQKEGFLIVALSWVCFSAFGMLPYLIYGTVDNVADAYFETISGFTTTGATVLSNIDQQPHGILFWRSLTQWLGGLGIVVFSLALLPLLGSSGTQMFNAEVSGLNVDKLRPKIQNTARQLWGIYIILTVLCAMLYWAGPMDLYDAINHALTTLATGGFSTHQSSIGSFNSAYTEYVCGIFMFIASINFSLFYFIGIGKFKQFWRNDEFKWLLYVTLGATVLFVILQCTVICGDHASSEQLASMGNDAESIFRTAFFHTSTIISSTGYQASHYDYMLWGEIFWIPTLILMVSGGCAGSTAGGVKMIRIIVLLKSTINEFLIQLHPRSVTSVRINGHAVSSDTVHKVLAFIFIYALLLIGSIFLLQCLGVHFEDAIGTVISALGNCGPGFGVTGPATTWAALPDLAKWYLSFAMLVGRLEIFTVILIFTRTFWKK